MSPRAALAFAFLAAPVLVGITALVSPPAADNGGPGHPGRSVYISEGCIHCHSQFVRPGVDEDAGLGAASVAGIAIAGNPALIGNRRLGPDLTHVGLRRNREWHRMHLIDPRRLAPDSLMPSYAHLFEPQNSRRGEALVDYLDSLGRGDASQQIRDAKAAAIEALPRKGIGTR